MATWIQLTRPAGDPDNGLLVRVENCLHVSLHHHFADAAVEVSRRFHGPPALPSVFPIFPIPKQ